MSWGQESASPESSGVRFFKSISSLRLSARKGRAFTGVQFLFRLLINLCKHLKASKVHLQLVMSPWRMDIVKWKLQFKNPFPLSLESYLLAFLANQIWLLFLGLKNQCTYERLLSNLTLPCLQIEHTIRYKGGAECGLLHICSTKIIDN